jgi:hypothetical protein
VGRGCCSSVCVCVCVTLCVFLPEDYIRRMGCAKSMLLKCVCVCVTLCVSARGLYKAHGVWEGAAARCRTLLRSYRCCRCPVGRCVSVCICMYVWIYILSVCICMYVWIYIHVCQDVYGETEWVV